MRERFARVLRDVLVMLFLLGLLLGVMVTVGLAVLLGLTR